MFSTDFDMDQNDVMISKLYGMLDKGVDNAVEIYSDLHRLIKGMAKPFDTYDIPRGAKSGTVITLRYISGVAVLKLITVTQQYACGSEITFVSNRDTNRTVCELNMNNIVKIVGHRSSPRFDEVCYYVEGRELFKKMVDRMRGHLNTIVKGSLLGWA